MKDLSFWAVTSFYNPARYQRRLDNFRVFRSRLGVPLLAVELAAEARHQLDPSDADVLLRVEGDVRIWQKERLLNLAMRALPPEAEVVAWLDCDVVFLNPSWAEETWRLLERGERFVQPFETAQHLSPEQGPLGDGGVANPLFREQSCASCLAASTYFDRAGMATRVEAERGLRPGQQPPVAHGMAWAARREDLQGIGLYDACVIGGGDKAFALAAMGRADLLERRRPMTPHQRRHFLEWAAALGNRRSARLGFVPGNLLHLWHGRLQRRGYRERHQLLVDLQFNPYEHLRMAPNGTWQWETHAEELGEAVRGYFVGRREDED